MPGLGAKKSLYLARKLRIRRSHPVNTFHSIYIQKRALLKRHLFKKLLREKYPITVTDSSYFELHNS
jgi:hypothetical protein